MSVALAPFGLLIQNTNSLLLNGDSFHQSSFDLTFEISDYYGKFPSLVELGGGAVDPHNFRHCMVLSLRRFYRCVVLNFHILKRVECVACCMKVAWWPISKIIRRL